MIYRVMLPLLLIVFVLMGLWVSFLHFPCNWVMCGTTVGMMIANAPAVFIGDKLADKLPISLIHKIGAAIFLVVGISALVQHYYF